MSDSPDDPAGLVDQIAAGEGVSLVRTHDPDEVALRLVDVLDAELLDSADELRDAVELRLEALQRRSDALAALELHARLHSDDSDDRAEVTDLRRLRALVDRIGQADTLVHSSREVLRGRLGSGMGVAVHPDALRSAAAEVDSARAAVTTLEERMSALQRELDAARASAQAELDAEVDASRARNADPGWDDDARRAITRSALALVVGVVVAVGALIVLGTPFAFAVPVVAGLWLLVLAARHRVDIADLDVASDNLAAVAAMTDQAYGGSVDQASSPELDDLRLQLAGAAARLRYSEGAWVGLVGGDAAVEDLDEMLRTRDPNHHVGEAELAQTPTLRAAQAHVRRLTAQWKLAWYALDRPVPAVAQADVALDALAEEGIDRITVPTHAGRSSARNDIERRFTAIADGRSIDELRDEANRQPMALVVVDADGSISEADLDARTAVLPKDVRVVVVAPSGG